MTYSPDCSCPGCRAERTVALRDRVIFKLNDVILERDATIERVKALATQWEQVGPSYQSLPEGAAQLRQALDEVPL